MNYWKKLGGALLDRIDIRVPVEPVTVDLFSAGAAENSAAVRGRVEAAAERQRKRFSEEPFSCNSRIPQGRLKQYCRMTDEAENRYISAVKKMKISSRACVSVIKTARTIADLRGGGNGGPEIGEDDVLEAIQHRRYGETDFFWSKL